MPAVDHGAIVRSSLTKAAIAGFPPLLAYVATTAGYAHWFDSGELVAAAADFGISHPPGQPLSAIALGASQWIPFGSLAFRASLVCALCGAVAITALTFAFERVLGAGNVVRESIRFPTAVAAAWWVAGGGRRSGAGGGCGRFEGHF